MNDCCTNPLLIPPYCLYSPYAEFLQKSNGHVSFKGDSSWVTPVCCKVNGPVLCQMACTTLATVCFSCSCRFLRASTVASWDRSRPSRRRVLPLRAPWALSGSLVLGCWAWVNTLGLRMLLAYSRALNPMEIKGKNVTLTGIMRLI